MTDFPLSWPKVAPPGSRRWAHWQGAVVPCDGGIARRSRTRKLQRRLRHRTAR